MEKRMEHAARTASPQEIEEQFLYMTKIGTMLSGAEPKKACVVTYGCQQNEADSERIAGMLREMGYDRAASETDADIIIVRWRARKPP